MVIAADKTLQKRLAAGAMAAGGAVQTFVSLDEAGGRIETDLALCALSPRDGGPPVIPPAVASRAARLPEAPLLVRILPHPDLEWMVALLADPRVPSVLSADGLTAGYVTATV